MLDKKEFTQLGTIGKPHGVAGEASIRLLPQLESADLTPSFIFIEIEGGLVPFRVESYRYKSDNILLVKLPLLAHEDKIRELMNCDVYLAASEINAPEAGLDNMESFTGYEVSDKNAGLLGTITAIQNIAGNPLFMIDGPQGEIMVPVAEEFIVSINDAEKTLKLNVPEGLLNLNE